MSLKIRASYGALAKRDRALVWLIVIAGIILPWATGAGVKLYLQAHGKPTLPWSSFLSPLSVLFELPFAIWFASPYFGLALFALAALGDRVASLRRLSTSERRLILICALAAGCVATIATFVSVFWEFDPLFFFTPLPLFYLGAMVAGLALGIGLALGSAWIRRHVRAST